MAETYDFPRGKGTAVIRLFERLGFKPGKDFDWVTSSRLRVENPALTQEVIDAIRKEGGRFSNAFSNGAARAEAVIAQKMQNAGVQNGPYRVSKVGDKFAVIDGRTRVIVPPVDGSDPTGYRTEAQAVAALQKMRNAGVKCENAEDGYPMEAYGVKGMKSTPWRKTFKSSAEFEKWVDQNDAEVHGMRPSK